MGSYPAEWERHERLRDGTRVLVRPIRGEDETLYPAFIAAESAEDARRRFFGAVRDLSHEFIVRLTHVDYDLRMAFIAIDEADGKMLGVVRLHRQ
jgi:acetyltransferase